MESSLPESILHICEALHECSVEYIIVGGTAVALHGYYRHSTIASGELAARPDLDFWYNPTYENYFYLLNALEKLGRDVSQFRQERTPNPKKSFFKYEFEKFTLDFLPNVKAPLQFRDCFKRREIVTFKNIEIPFISYDDLLKDKKANARAKDITDIQHLTDRRNSLGE